MKAIFAMCKKTERGQATLEFVILLPLLLSIILLIVYGGWWSYTRLSAQNFLYANCTGIARARGFNTISERGYRAAYDSRQAWDVHTIYDRPVDAKRTGSTECTAILQDMAGQTDTGSWNFNLVLQSRGAALFPPFMSCDGGYCQ